MRLFLTALVCLYCGFPGLSAAQEKSDFERDVFPILEERCLDCHDAETRKGGVGLDTFYHAHQPTDSGEPLFAPGDPANSLLIHLVEETDPEHRMPPKGDPLTAEQIKTLRNWIRDGAKWPDDGWRPPKHWSYETPQLPDVPGDGKDWGRNEIDSFIYRKLTEKRLAPNPEADPAVLLRRVSLDLTGFPPTVEEVDAFLADPSEANYERAVDRLLKSRAFGERWARHWLDLARYADSEGYQRDELRYLWPWRDWVIEALNADLPFDQFTIEQLAGDLLPDATDAQKIATGFQRNTPLNLEAGTDPNEDHYKQVVDRVNTLGSVWLGTTLACGQCHNHKYDPVSTREYYELFAFFNQTPQESRQKGKAMGMSGMEYIGPTLALKLDKDAKVRRREQIRERNAMRVQLMNHLDPKWEELESSPERLAELTPTVRASVEKLRERRTDKDVERVVTAAFKEDRVARKLTKEIRKLNGELNESGVYSTRVMEELAEPRPTFVARRGDFLSRGQEVRPDVPDVWPAFPEDAPRNRLGLARWLVDANHPLTARVTMNRLWAEVFGAGIVPTLEEFGAQAEPATHPDLLDWLAVTFVRDDGWSLKKALRRIVLSGTYRQSSVVRTDAAEIDPTTQYLWRHPGHRLDAETIRDNGLFISGLLNDKMGGPPVYPWQPEGVWRKGAGAGPSSYTVSKDEDRFRRGIYTVWKRAGHYASFANFDAPERSICSVQRGRSNTPLQALVLMNDQVYVEMAEAFANRIATEFTGDVDARLERAFRSVLSRYPTPAERSHLKKAFTGAGGEEDGCFDVASILMNLHQTIHR